MKTYWNIVPKDDGYTYIGYEDGKHIVYNKGSGELNTSLLFKTKKECTDYINTHLTPKKYVEEEIWVDEKHYNLK